MRSRIYQFINSFLYILVFGLLFVLIIIFGQKDFVYVDKFSKLDLKKTDTDYYVLNHLGQNYLLTNSVSEKITDLKFNYIDLPISDNRCETRSKTNIKSISYEEYAYAIWNVLDNSKNYLCISRFDFLKKEWIASKQVSQDSVIKLDYDFNIFNNETLYVVYKSKGCKGEYLSTFFIDKNNLERISNISPVIQNIPKSCFDLLEKNIFASKKEIVFVSTYNAKFGNITEFIAKDMGVVVTLFKDKNSNNKSQIIVSRLYDSPYKNIKVQDFGLESLDEFANLDFVSTNSGIYMLIFNAYRFRGGDDIDVFAGFFDYNLNTITFPKFFRVNVEKSGNQYIFPNGSLLFYDDKFYIIFNSEGSLARDNKLNLFYKEIDLKDFQKSISGKENLIYTQKLGLIDYIISYISNNSIKVYLKNIDKIVDITMSNL